jgi:hypothetical protein
MSDLQVSELDSRSVGAATSGKTAVSATAIVASLALAKLLLQFAGMRHYGFFRDELYYMACGEHLAWGYVDQPPVVAFLVWFARHVFGSSLISMRLLPALAGAAVVFLTGTLARELGGKRFAQFLAAAAILFAPSFLAFDSFFSMNAFEPLFWLVCALIAVRIVRGATPRLWLAFGAVAGLGLENKHTMLVFGFALVAGLLLAREERLFRSRWIWIGGLLAFGLFLPNLVWEARHGWPQIQVVRNAQLFKNVPVSHLRFLGEQVALLDPLALPVWVAGLAWYFSSRQGRRFRFLGWAYLIVLGTFMLLHGKTYYPLPVYPLLMAAGGVAWEELAQARTLVAVRIPLATIVILGGLMGVPFGVPVLPIHRFLNYSQLLPYSSLVKTERDAVSVRLPQLYADMFGWDNMARTVAGVYHDLPVADQADCAILAGNYGEAGAIDYYGPALGLPKAISGHNSYFYWGPRGYSGACVIIFGERSNEFITYFGDVQRAATVKSPLAMPNERLVPVYVCRKPREPLSALWPRFKMII